MFRCLVGRHPPESTARINAICNGREDSALRQIKGECKDVEPEFISIVEWLLRHIVITPAIRMSEIADDVSKGNLNAPELNASGSDEIPALGKSFS